MSLSRPARRDRPSDRAYAQVVSLPIWVWLAGIVTLSATIEVLAGRQIRSPLVFADELIFWELARSFASGGHFLLREVPTSFYGPVTRLYPALISPGFKTSPNLTHVYAVVKAINAVLMSSAAIPAYFIAQRVLSRAMALVAAALAVAIPSLVYTSMVMTENAAYPAFLLCALAMIHALERPAPRRQLAVLATIVLAFAVRAQAVVLVPSYLSAILLLAWLESERGARINGLRRAFTSYRTTWLALGAGTLATLAAGIGWGKSPTLLLGSYGVVGGGTHPASIPRWFLYQLADLDLYVGAAPFAACCIVLPLALRGLHGRRLRVFATVTVSLFTWLMLTVAQFSSTVWGLHRLHERNLFYVVPLILIGFLVYFDIDTTRCRRLKLGAVIVTAALPAALPFGELIRGALVDTLALLPWTSPLVGPGIVPLAMTAFAAGLGALILLPRRFAPILVLVVAFNFYVLDFQAHSDARSVGQTVAGASADQQWIDDAVGSNANVVAVWFPGSRACVPRSRRTARGYSAWKNEFFNRSVRKTFYVGRRLDDLPAGGLAVDPRTFVLKGVGGNDFRPRYVALSDDVRLHAPVVAHDAQTRTSLYQVGRKARVVPPRNCPAFLAGNRVG